MVLRIYMCSVYNNLYIVHSFYLCWNLSNIYVNKIKFYYNPCATDPVNVCYLSHGTTMIKGQIHDNGVVQWGAGKEAPYIGMGTPEVMRNNFAASQVVDLKSKMAISLVCLKHGGICVFTQVLQ